MAKYLSPCFDLVFKKIFGEHPELTRSFLNAVLPLSQDQVIESLKYLSPEQAPDNAEKRNSIVDVRCRDNYRRMMVLWMRFMRDASIDLEIAIVMYKNNEPFVAERSRRHNLSP